MDIGNPLYQNLSQNIYSVFIPLNAMFKKELLKGIKKLSYRITVT